MKKTIIILLVLIMVLSLAACGGGSTTTNTPTPTEAPATPEPTPETKPTLNDSRALALAKDYVSANDYYLKQAAKGYNSKVYSISSISVASTTAAEKKISNSFDNGYEIIAKGTFTAKDDFGNTIEKYNFTWKLGVDYWEDTTNWMYLEWSTDSSSITISK